MPFGVAKREQGTVLSARAGEEPHFTRYQDLRAVAARGVAEPLREGEGEGEVEERLAAPLADSVRQQRVADVPVGTFLSEGVDSSTVVALMAAEGARPKTFTIGFADAALNEAPDAEAVARQFGTDHTTPTMTEREALDMVPRLPELCDELFADPSGVPIAVVCRLARTRATAALSGDVGDELCSDCRRYVVALELWQRVQGIPRLMRHLAGALLARLPLIRADAIGQALPGGAPVKAFGHRLRRVRAILIAGTFPRLDDELIAMWAEPPIREGTVVARWPEVGPHPSPLDHMRLVDQPRKLRDDILTKVDRASMAGGREVRVPLLDHCMMKFALSLPPARNPSENGGKRMLRRVLYRRVPRALIERPKQGFTTPTGAWLKGILRDWAEDLLAPCSLAESRLDPGPIRELWQAHLFRRANEQYRLWTAQVDQAWRRRSVC